MMPGALAYAYLGYTAREAIKGRPDLVSKAFWAVTLLAAVALLPSLLRRWRCVERLAPHQLYARLSQGAPLVLDVRSRVMDKLEELCGQFKGGAPARSDPPRCGGQQAA